MLFRSIKRDFGGIFITNPTIIYAGMSGGRIDPGYAIGDFNGDGKSDLAVLVSFDLSVLAERFAADPNWSIPRFRLSKALIPGDGPREIKKSEISLKSILAGRRDRSVLLIVHDFDLNGRKQNASAYGVRDGYANNVTTMSITRQRLKANSAGDSPVMQPPRTVGDILLLLDPDGIGSAIYWQNGGYAWVPVGRQ